MGKRANGSGGSGTGDNGSGAGNPPARGIRPRSGATATVNLAARFRDHFDAFVEAGYRIAALEGPRGIDARRQLVKRLEAGRPLMDDVIALLRAEIVDMTRAQAAGRDQGSEKP